MTVKGTALWLVLATAALAQESPGDEIWQQSPEEIRLGIEAEHPVAQATLGRVLAWDEQTENGFTSKATHAAAWSETRRGLEGMIEYVAANTESIREQRTANGLENRN